MLGSQTGFPHILSGVLGSPRGFPHIPSGVLGSQTWFPRILSVVLARAKRGFLIPRVILFGVLWEPNRVSPHTLCVGSGEAKRGVLTSCGWGRGKRNRASAPQLSLRSQEQTPYGHIRRRDRWASPDGTPCVVLGLGSASAVDSGPWFRDAGSERSSEAFAAFLADGRRTPVNSFSRESSSLLRFLFVGLVAPLSPHRGPPLLRLLFRRQKWMCHIFFFTLRCYLDFRCFCFLVKKYWGWGTRLFSRNCRKLLLS